MTERGQWHSARQKSEKGVVCSDEAKRIMDQYVPGQPLDNEEWDRSRKIEGPLVEVDADGHEIGFDRDVAMLGLVNSFDLQTDFFYESLGLITETTQSSSPEVERSHMLMSNIDQTFLRIAKSYMNEIEVEARAEAVEGFRRVKMGIIDENATREEGPVTRETKLSLTALLAIELDKMVRFGKNSLPNAQVPDYDAHDMVRPHVESIIDVAIKQRKLDEAPYELARTRHGFIRDAVNSVNQARKIAITYR